VFGQSCLCWLVMHESLVGAQLRLSAHTECSHRHTVVLVLCPPPVRTHFKAGCFGVCCVGIVHLAHSESLQDLFAVGHQSAQKGWLPTPL
jgi:hypothetical protein